MSQLLTLPHAGTLSIRAKALVFEDPVSVELLRRTEQVGATDATVLIVGDTGTGKELLARHVHQASGRRGPFVPVNCGAFSESLVDAELFGHESGAFTGASHARPGWFEAAKGGTLFLDEIGDLPLAQQVKLLRVLQERQVTRIGSRRPVDLDVRLVAATNVDLHDAVRAGRFRADLYYRLNVAALELPPLARRPADILPLARHFLDVHARHLGVTGAAFTDAAREALLQHAWPGNIRELENAVHRALIVAPDGLIRPEDLRLATPVAMPAAAAPVLPPPRPAPEDFESAVHRLVLAALQRGEPRVLDRVEAQVIATAHDHVHGNQVRTARALGVTRNVVRTLLKRHGRLPAADGGDDAAVPDTGAQAPAALHAA